MPDTTTQKETICPFSLASGNPQPCLKERCGGWVKPHPNAYNPIGCPLAAIATHLAKIDRDMPRKFSLF